MESSGTLVTSLSFAHGHGDMGVTVERWHRPATRLSFQPACHVDRLPLAASLLNGHPLFKPLWSECVSQPAVPLLRQPLRLLTQLQQGWEVTDHREREDIIGGTGRLFVLSDQIKMLICPCPNLFTKKGNKIGFVIRSLPWLCLEITDKLIE